MKIKSMLVPFVAFALVAFVSYYIGGSMRGWNSDQQSVTTPTLATEHFAPPQKFSDEATNREKDTVSNTATVDAKQIEAIEAEYERKKQEVEEYYANEFRKLQQKVDITFKEFDASDRAAYASFIERLKDTVSETSGSVNTLGYVSPSGYISTQGYYDGTTSTHVVGNPSLEYKNQIRRTNEAVKKMMSEYELDLAHLLRRRACALDDLEKEKKQALISDSYQNINSSVRKINPVSQGTVTGILFSEGTPLTVINGEVFREGQTINGVKVVRINQDSVEFEHSEKHWSQKVNEPPLSFWP